MKKVGILTGGGDAPGMNAVIRAVVRSSIFAGFQPIGIFRGFAGLIEGEIKPLDLSSVSGIINRGGTMLRTIRYPEFKEPKIIKKAINFLSSKDIEYLITVGGDGTSRATLSLYKEGIKANFIPASIDNDIPGTDYTVGFDTALDTAVEAIDKIRDTATSHERVFIIEVMGKGKGFIGLSVGLASGAEVIIIPEIKRRIEDIISTLSEGRKRGKRSFIVVVSEGAIKIDRLSREISEKLNCEVRIAILGHLQRGGSPNGFSRILGSRFGNFAFHLLEEGKAGNMVGICGNQLVYLPLERVVKEKKEIDKNLYQLASILAT